MVLEFDQKSSDKHAVTKAEKHDGGSFTETFSEFASSLSAGISGASTLSLVKSVRPVKALAIPFTLAAGSLTKFGVKNGLEQLLVAPDQRTAGAMDLAWGAVDAFAGVAASWADRRASRKFLTDLGKKALGQETTALLEQQAGRQILASHAVSAVKHGAYRSFAGGAAGSFMWSVPHAIEENKEQLWHDPRNGALSVSRKVLRDTISGAALGSIFVGGGTAALRSAELAGTARAALTTNDDLLFHRTLHINDLHSHNSKLAAMKPVTDRLLAQAEQKGISSDFVAAGDMEGSNIQYRPEKSGAPENSALIAIGVRKFIPGNHTYDFGSGFNVPGYVQTMTTLKQQHPHISLIATNLNLSELPAYERLANRFTIDTVAGPHGPEKIATLGLVTRQGTALDGISGIGYLDPHATAVKTMIEVAQNHGVNKFLVLSHLGLDEDLALAQALTKDGTLASHNLKVAAIVGAHTHDVTAAPIWVGRNGVSTGGVSKWLNRQGGNYEIPVVQAGSTGRWVGQLDLSVRADGSADPYRTFGRLHAITEQMPRDKQLDQFVNLQMSEVMDLRRTQYNTRVLSDLSKDGLRRRETPLGNLVSDAIDQDVKPDAVLTQSCWFNNGLCANVDRQTGGVFRPLTREDVANLFKSTGNVEAEKQELGVFKIRGSELRNILEHGARQYPAPRIPTVTQRLRNVFSDQQLNPPIDEPGDFLQVAGLKYEVDFSKTPLTAVKPGATPGTIYGDGHRIGNIWMRDASTGNYVSLDAQREYSIAARHFSFNRWNRFGIFGDRVVGQTSVPRSPVEMIGNLIRNRTIEPATFRPEGRIIDLTPAVAELPIKISPSIVAFPSGDLHDKHGGVRQ